MHVWRGNIKNLQSTCVQSFLLKFFALPCTLPAFLTHNIPDRSPLFLPVAIQLVAIRVWHNSNLEVLSRRYYWWRSLQLCQSFHLCFLPYFDRSACVCTPYLELWSGLAGLVTWRRQRPEGSWLDSHPAGLRSTATPALSMSSNFLTTCSPW